ncbi:MAG TPA: TonB family protein [Candidatus Omnitrophica bacterium]|nr:TonB family protein [Candidatus Omnitrophota bacterium]
MSLRRFFIYSIAVHMLVMIVVAMYKPAVDNKKPSGVLITRLIAPEEFFIQTPTLPALPQRSPPFIERKQNVPAQKTENRSPRVSEEGMGEEPVPSTSLPLSPPVPTPSSPSQGRRGTSESEQLIQTLPRPQYLPREKLFDKGVIGDLAKRETVRGKGEKEGERGKSLTLDTKDYKFLIYNMRLKERIENIWIYPHDAAKRGIYGDLIIRFTIKKNGTLGAVELVRTSGYQNLDSAAMKALKDGEPYWPLPDEWEMENYTILGHFVYTIYGYYLR